jgi:hypothetical protein
MSEIKKLIKQTIKSRYVAEYQAGIKDSEALGGIVSAYFEWDGVRILDCLQAALEDANFHSLNEEITLLREKEGV